MASRFFNSFGSLARKSFLTKTNKLSTKLLPYILVNNQYSSKIQFKSDAIPFETEEQKQEEIEDVPIYFNQTKEEELREIEEANERGLDEGWEIKNTTHKGWGVYALRSYQPGELINSSLKLGTAPDRDKFSLQWDDDTHIYLNLPGRFFNHCCFSNVGIQNNYDTESYDFYALQEIKEGEELTWNYETTEFISICIVGEAQCSKKGCIRNIKGFKSNKKFIKDQYGDYIADYLKDY